MAPLDDLPFPPHGPHDSLPTETLSGPIMSWRPAECQARGRTQGDHVPELPRQGGLEETDF